MNKSCKDIISKNGDKNKNQQVMLDGVNDMSVKKQVSSSHTSAAGAIISCQCAEVTGRIIRKSFRVKKIKYN